MKIIFSLLFFLAATTFSVHAADLPAAEVLITGCGEFTLAPDLTLTISADAQQAIHCDLKQTSQGASGLPASTTRHLNISGGAGAKFFFCWQPADRCLWWADADSLDRSVCPAADQASFQITQTHHTLHDGRNLPNLPTLLATALAAAFPR